MHTTDHQYRDHDLLFSARGTRIYGAAAKTLMRGVYRRIAEDVADTAPDGAALLDVGTGPGVLLMEAARRRGDLQAVGVDPSEEMVAAAERNFGPYGARLLARTGDAAELPFPEASFDMVVSSFSMHHWADPAAAAPELARVLRPGGRVYLYDLPYAPFTQFTAAARERGVLTGRPNRRTAVRVPGPLGLVVPICARQVLTKSDEDGAPT